MRCETRSRESRNGWGFRAGTNYVLHLVERVQVSNVGVRGFLAMTAIEVGRFPTTAYRRGAKQRRRSQTHVSELVGTAFDGSGGDSANIRPVQSKTNPWAGSRSRST